MMQKESLILKATKKRGCYTARSQSNLSIKHKSSPMKHSMTTHNLAPTEIYSNCLSEASVLDLNKSLGNKQERTFSEAPNYLSLSTSFTPKTCFKQILILEKDLAEVRQQCISILDEKVKIEKELIICKNKIKNLEEKLVLNKIKVHKFDEFVEISKKQKAKLEENEEELAWAHRNLKEICDKNDRDRSENIRVLRGYEEKLRRLAKENGRFKVEIIKKDEEFEGVKKELESLKFLYEEFQQNKAIKTLSNIILSKSHENQNELLPALENKNSQRAYTELLLKYKDLEHSNTLLVSLIKSEDFLSASSLVDGFDPNQSFLLTPNSTSSTSQKLKTNFYPTSPPPQDLISPYSASLLSTQAQLIEDLLKNPRRPQLKLFSKSSGNLLKPPNKLYK